MIFQKRDHLVGLDIGSKTIKVADVQQSKKGYHLKKFGSIDIPYGLIEEGTIKDPKKISASIRELFRMNGIKEKKVAISIGGYSVIVKTINVQAMSEEEFNETIYLEAEQYIPFDISDVNLDFQILKEGDDENEQMNVLLVAAKKDMIDDYANIIYGAGLSPSIIDVDAFALQNVYEVAYLSDDMSSEDENENLVALIDIGAYKTSLNVLKYSDSLFMRDIPLGCGQIDSEIQSQTGCSVQEAELIKLGKTSNQISPEEVRSIYASVVNDWSSEITRALDFFYSSYPDNPIKTILLSGGGGKVDELKDILSTETGATVEKINPFIGVSIDKKNDPNYLEEMATQAAICMGLALRRVDDK